METRSQGNNNSIIDNTQAETALSIVPDNGLTLLDIVPKDILKNVLVQKLDTISLSRFSSVNGFAYGLFQPVLLQRKKRELEKHVERSEKAQVERLLSMGPRFELSYLHDLCQRVLLDRDIDLLQVIIKVRPEILDSIEIPEQFLDESNTYNFSNIAAALDSEDENGFAKAWDQFLADLYRINREKGFPFQALLDAHKYYDENCDRHDPEVCIEFNVRVIGALHRISPAWFKKALATGITDIFYNDKACGDTFTLQSGECIDPELEVHDKGLAIEFFVNITGHARNLDNKRGWRHVIDTDIMRGFFNQKQQRLMELLEAKQKRLAPGSEDNNQSKKQRIG